MQRILGLVIFIFITSTTTLLAQPELQLAEQYYAQEEYERALDYLDDLEKKYTNKKIYELKLDCYLALGDFKKAEKHIENHIRTGRHTDYDYFADLTYVFLEQDKKDKAKDVVEDVKDRVFSNPGLAYGYANAFQTRGFPAIALEIYETAEKKMPNSGYLYQKALLYGELGDIPKMYEAYVDMVSYQPSYLNTAKQLLGRAMQEEYDEENSQYIKELLIRRIQEGGPQALNELLVYIFIQEKNFDGAFTQLRALDKRNPGNKAELFSLGRVAMNNEEYLTARRIFKYIIDAGPENPFYENALLFDLRAEKLRLLANSSTTAKQWTALQLRYFEVLRKLKGMPEVGELTVDLADITAFQLEQPDTAIAMLKDVISTGYIGPQDQAIAKIKLADILLYEGERWEAIIYYGQAEKAFEQSPIGQEAKFKRAKAAYYVGDFEWAQGIFNALKASTSKTIANDALYYSILISDNTALDSNMEAMEMYARADLMNYQNKSDSALHILGLMDIAYLSHPIHDEVLFLRAKILVKRNEYGEAAKTLEALIKEHSSDILADDAQYMLAGLYENQLGRVAEAQELYKNLFTEHPDSFFASDARKRYRELRGDVFN